MKLSPLLRWHHFPAVALTSLALMFVGCDKAKNALDSATAAAENAISDEDSGSDGGSAAATTTADNSDDSGAAATPPKPMTPVEKLAAFKSLPKREMNDTKLQELVSLGSALEELTELDLSGAPVGPRGLQAIGTFTALKSLSLRGLKVQPAAMAPLARLTNLEVLDLTDTSFGDAAAQFLIPLTNMRELHLVGTPITDETFRGLTEMKQLDTLSVSRTQIYGSGLQLLKSSPIRVLEANESQFGQQGFKYVKRLQNLEVLRVHNAWVSNEALQSVKSCKGLKELAVGGNPNLVNDGIKCLRSLKKLEKLSLAGNKAVSDKGLRFAIDLKELKELDVNETACSQLAAKQLKENLPNAKIMWRGQTL